MPFVRRCASTFAILARCSGWRLIVAVFALIAPGFLAERNLMNILQQSSINACVALGMTLVIISGGIDLSVGPTAALSAVLSASLMVAGVPLVIAVFAGLALGAICGLVNGCAGRFRRASALHCDARNAQHLSGPGAHLHRRQSGPWPAGGFPQHRQRLSLRPSGFRDRGHRRGVGGGDPAAQDAVRRISARGRRQRRGGAYCRRADRAHQDRRLCSLRRAGEPWRR